MAKKGLQYYMADTDRFQDMRIKRLRKTLGCVGYAIYCYLLNEIYRVEGYFLVWNEDMAFDVADYWGVKEQTVEEAVNYCCYVGLFDKELRTNGNILTSGAIQRRYIEICRRMNRPKPEIPDFVIPKIREKSSLSNEESSISNEKMKKPCDRTELKERKEEKQKKTLSPERVQEKERFSNQLSQDPESTISSRTDTWPKVFPEKAQDNYNRYALFQDWIQENAPYCANPKNFQQITESELERLLEKFSSKTIFTVISNLENRRDLRKRYSNLYRTVLNWCKHEHE